LRELLPATGQAAEAEWFDEYMGEHEFGLALEVACDYLAEKRQDAINPSLIKLIEELHLMMKVDDDCVSRLRTVRAAFA
jgi:hypothetical protein